MPQLDLDEQLLTNKKAEYGQHYFKKYRGLMESLEKESPLSNVRSITEYDFFALGRQLDQFKAYEKMCEETGTRAALGQIPNIAMDVITLEYGASPLSVIASVQPIDEQRGNAYYKRLQTSSTRGSHTAGDTVFDARSGGQTPLEGFSGDTLTTDIGQTAAATLQYTGTLSNTPLLPGYVVFEIPGLNIKARDDSSGLIVGYKVYGTIDYDTGAYVINLVDDPAGTHDMTFTTAINFEAADDIPTINFILDSLPVDATVHALKSTIGMEQIYALQQRFGLIAEDEMTNDLVAAMNSEIFTKAVRLLNADASSRPGSTFSKTAPSAVSDFEHRRSFTFKVAEAEASLVSRAGKGQIDVMICGMNGASIISTLPGFQKVASGSEIGPHIYGTWDNKVIIRVQNQNILNTDRILCLHRGNSPFDAALVWAPYMPLVTTQTLPTGANPLTEQKAAASWAALDRLVSNYVTKIELTS